MLIAWVAIGYAISPIYNNANPNHFVSQPLQTFCGMLAVAAVVWAASIVWGLATLIGGIVRDIVSSQGAPD